LWNLEADVFFDVERPNYKNEAEKYGYRVFETAEDFMLENLSSL